MRLMHGTKNRMRSLLNNFGYDIKRIPKSIDPRQFTQEERYAQPMKISYRARVGSWNGKLLCVTHSERPIEAKYRSLNYLETRFSRADRLPPKQPFNSLWPSTTFSPHLGQVTIWGFKNGNFSKPSLLAHLTPRPNGYKPQFAAWYDSRLWILGIEGVEVYNADLKRIAVIFDPWLSGGHTIMPDYARKSLLVSCSGSDSVLVINKDTLEVTERLRVPESVYGSNYKLSPEDSTVQHYIDNDSQLTHINCAWPWGDRVLVSNFIQGAIGCFEKDGRYQELLRGFVGCHGVRVDARSNMIYFCDSCLGALVFLDSGNSIQARVSAESTWLHDAQQLDNDIFALAVADRNTIDITNVLTRKRVTSINGADFGNTTQFVYFGV